MDNWVNWNIVDVGPYRHKKNSNVVDKTLTSSERIVVHSYLQPMRNWCENNLNQDDWTNDVYSIAWYIFRFRNIEDATAFRLIFK